jgi:hypothetical protein
MNHYQQWERERETRQRLRAAGEARAIVDRAVEAGRRLTPEEFRRVEELRAEIADAIRELRGILTPREFAGFERFVPIFETSGEGNGNHEKTDH